MGMIVKYGGIMKVLVSVELKSAYTLNGDELEYAPIVNNVFDTEKFDYIDIDLVGDEVVTYNGRQDTLKTVYQDIKTALL